MGRSFEDLEVWKRGCRLAVQLYGLLKNCRDFGIKDQVLRTAISIPSNIAEGSEKDSVPNYRRYLGIAKGSAAELRTQVYICQNVRILEKQQARKLVGELKTIFRMLQGLHVALGRQL